MRALEALAHERTVSRLKQDYEDGPSVGDTYALPYDPISVFLLEMMVSIAFQSSDHVEFIW